MMKKSPLTRPIILGVAAACLIAAVIWLNRPLQLPFFNQFNSIAQAQSKDKPKAPSNMEAPDVNPAAFKDQGLLAFIWKDLLYALDGSTGEVKQLTEAGKAYQPAWSHDGEWLAFIRISDASSMTGPLWLVRRDGTQAHQVQGLPESVMPERFSWSPGDNVLAVSAEDGLWLVPTEGEPRRLVPVSSGYPSFSWSPDGKSIAYNITLSLEDPDLDNRKDVLYIVTVADGKTNKYLETNAGIQLVGWQPDGKGLLYWFNPSRGASVAADGLELWSLQLDEKEPRALTSGLTYRQWQSFSPQGQLLTVAGGDRIVWSNKNLALVDPKTGKVQNIPNPKGCVALDPQFSPDGKKIAFVAAKDLGSGVWGFEKTEDLAKWVDSRTLYIANADGSDARALETAGKGVFQPFWSKDGKHLLYMKDNVLWSIEVENGKPEKILGPIDDQDLFGFYGFVSYYSLVKAFK